MKFSFITATKDYFSTMLSRAQYDVRTTKL